MMLVKEAEVNGTWVSMKILKPSIGWKQKENYGPSTIN